MVIKEQNCWAGELVQQVGQLSDKSSNPGKQGSILALHMVARARPGMMPERSKSEFCWVWPSNQKSVKIAG